MNKIRAVLDTNALLISIGRKSKFRPIFDNLLNGNIELIVTNEILTEYVEILERKTNSIVANNIIEVLIQLKNVEKIEVSYKWNLIIEDPDDNKFVDCAIAGRVRYIVTNDRHFSQLKNIPFPKVDIISIQDFLEEIEHL